MHILPALPARDGLVAPRHAHRYLNHVQQARVLPVMRFKAAKNSLFDFDYDIVGYDPIKAPVAV